MLEIHCLKVKILNVVLSLLSYFVWIKRSNEVEVMLHGSVKAVIVDHVVLICHKVYILSIVKLKLPVSKKRPIVIS